MEWGENTDTSKTAAVTPIHKKGEKRCVQNYRPVSLLDIESKILEKCIYVALYDHFAFFLTEHQHGFVKNWSVFTNLITFLKKIHDALDNNPNSEVFAFYTDFSRAFDKVSHFELLNKGCKYWGRRMSPASSHGLPKQPATVRQNR